jgi:hypothetical protein
MTAGVLNERIVNVKKNEPFQFVLYRIAFKRAFRWAFFYYFFPGWPLFRNLWSRTIKWIHATMALKKYHPAAIAFCQDLAELAKGIDWKGPMVGRMTPFGRRPDLKLYVLSYGFIGEWTRRAHRVVEFKTIRRWSDRNPLWSMVWFKGYMNKIYYHLCELRRFRFCILVLSAIPVLPKGKGGRKGGSFPQRRDYGVGRVRQLMVLSWRLIPIFAPSLNWFFNLNFSLLQNDLGCNKLFRPRLGQRPQFQ